MTNIFAFREEAGLRRFKLEIEGSLAESILTEKTNYRMHPPHSSPAANRAGLRLDEVNFQRVRVPVDFSVCTLETLRYAKALVEKSGAVADVLHVVQPSLGRNEAVMPGLGLIRTMIEGARQDLKRLVGMLWANEPRAAVSIRVREVRADEVILHEAGTTHASLIVMGMRNRRWLSGLLRRHAVKHVMQNAPCPVIVLRPGVRSRRVFS